MSEILRVNDPSTPWLEILVNFGFQNKPCILGNWATKNWNARKNWVNEDGTPNVRFLENAYGTSIVPISVNEKDQETTTFEEYLETGKCAKKYLKDWHFQNEYGTSMYNLHPFFARDFVNCENWTSDKETNPFGDDYRFVYYGASGSWTKFHSDVVSSHSWSANICGRKKWLMVPQGNEKLFSSSSKNGFIEDIRDRAELFETAGVIEFIQEPGEIVFVPSNWYHQVHNMTETISINHNWVNATNLNLVYEFIKNRNEDVLKELEDCKEFYNPEEFEEQVELILFADARLNKKKFEKLCKLVLSSRKSSWTCEIHETSLHLCLTNPQCHQNILKICECSTSFCEKCLQFIESLESSVASSFLGKQW